MAITQVSEWSTTAANNTELNGIAIGNNALSVSLIDNVVRELMAQTKAKFDTTADASATPGLTTENTFTLSQTFSAAGTTSTPTIRLSDDSGARGVITLSAGRIGFVVKGLLAGVIDERGTTTTDGQSFMTFEKANARYALVSSVRYKTELSDPSPVDFELAEEYAFRYMPDSPARAGERSRGLVLEDLVAAGLPEAARGDGLVDWGPVIGALWGEVVRLRARVAALEAV